MDIVERLRTEAPSYVLIGDAAVEIERLREALRKIDDIGIYECGNDCCDMQEIARAALKEGE
jgi:hypothetical protein